MWCVYGELGGGVCVACGSGGVCRCGRRGWCAAVVQAAVGCGVVCAVCVRSVVGIAGAGAGIFPAYISLLPFHNFPAFPHISLGVI